VLIGIVKWYDSKKGFGFILDPSGEDVLVHYTAIEGEGFRSLRTGEKVAYTVVRNPRGLQAQIVRRLEPVEWPPLWKTNHSQP
jgi:cold shock protein